MRRLVFVLVGVFALLLSACSSEVGSGAAGTTASTGTTAPTGSTTSVTASGNPNCPDLTGEGGTFTITIADFAFDPPCFTASASQGIEIVNEDEVDHTFTVTGTPIDIPVAALETFNAGPIPGVVTLGAYDFHCALHPQTTGRVTILA